MSDYGGTDNLEAMAQAINYNSFLFDLAEGCSSEGATVLDFGAGIGTFAAEMRRRGLDVRCVEPDAQQALRLSKDQFVVYQSIDDSPVETFDYVYSLNVLEHIEDDELALRQIYQKLRPGGRLLVYVPAFQLLYSSMDRKVGHFRRYRKGDLAGRLARAGFKVSEARYCDSLGFFASLVFKLVGDESGSLNVRALVAYDRFLFPMSRLLDKLVDRILGKNVLAIAHRP